MEPSPMRSNGRRLLQHSAMSLLVLFISSIATSEAVETRCIARERRALLQFKNGFVDDYGVFPLWGSETQDCCLWRGVGCSNRTNHVITLDLHGNWSYDLDEPIGFRGDINSSLLELHHLRHLDLSLNSITTIPEFIGSLTKLRYLNLSFTGILASEVPQLGNLSYLKTLDLSTSSFILKNTEWIAKLSSLEYLDLSYLDLSDSNNLLESVITRLPSLFVLHLRNCSLPKIPEKNVLQFTNFSKSLSILDLSSNDLPSFSIYPWLFNFSESLTNINLSNNKLLGTISEAFGAFKSLKNLDLTSNGLEGGIPSSFANFSNLRSLYLAQNNLKQDLATFFHNLLGPTEKSIHVLELSWNKISGSLPDFTTFTSLRELRLKKNELNGTFPEKFDQVSNIIILDLAENHMRGFLPDLSALSSLRELYIDLNHMEGTLGEKIMHLSALQYLGVFSNNFNGTISKNHLANLSHLVYLDLSRNSLTLELDSDWSPSFSLDIVSLSSCKLGPSFPTWLKTQKNFTIIDISDAQINDSVPAWFWNQLTSNLRYLNLSSNQIHGTVPNLINGDQPYIDLSFNNFSGTIPLFPVYTQTLALHNNKFSGRASILCHLPTIGRLDLSNNHLSGELPDCWMNLAQLSILNLENNNFSGRIPTSMGSLLYIVMLRMRNNNLTGELPSSLQGCAMLQLLDVGQNKLSGPIPAWIGESLLELRVLILTSNGFHGTMPTSFCNLTNIQILDISVNNISGTIPRCLSNLTSMTKRKTGVSIIASTSVTFTIARRVLKPTMYMFTALLQWKGIQSEYSNTLGLVTSLDLSSNMFNGEIPGEITNLLGLVALNLSRNNLTSEIPQDIGRLKWLNFLDISSNHLVGRIPASLSQLTALGMLDLSNNNLSGRIPVSTNLQSFHISSFAENPTLCGLPLLITCPEDFVPTNQQTTVEANYDEDQDKLINHEFFISLSIGLALGFWVVCGTLAVNDSWRHAYFKFLSRAKDSICVVIAVNYSRLKRLF